MQNFKKFLSKVEKSNFPTLTSEVTGVTTIQQTKRNELRSEGLKALKADLEVLLAPFEVLEVPNGLVIVAENEPGDFTFSWLLTSTIKAIDPYDPFEEAARWDEERAAKVDRKDKQVSRANR